jgi:hypothetical protein
MINLLADYPYSSYHYYANGSYDALITANPSYLQLGKTAPHRKKLYIEYINMPRPYEKIFDEKLEISR